MEAECKSNYACLCGTTLTEPVLSHENRGVPYYKVPIDVRRLSGTCDRLNVVLPGQMAAQAQIVPGARFCVRGEVRSFNNRTGLGNKLIISVLAREFEPYEGEDENVVCLVGALCKKPNLRVTPLGREICDLMLAVNRNYGRADYLPCIAWGESAREASCLNVGDRIALSGRLQSRNYIKCEDGKNVEKTAFEVSILEFTPR
ncbi:MAG: single-stranded DNA-binding protein [Clostridiales bacterium]|jgi:primosomal replication protein N|nr:single-stranded DNA-binding protein [Clostridiales bacterium]